MAKFKTARNWLFYSGLFFSCLMFFSYFVFPYERLRDWAIFEIENPRTGQSDKEGEPKRRKGKMQVSIESLRPFWFTGIEAEGVEIRTRAEKLGDTATKTQIDEVRARLDPLALFTGTIRAIFDASVGAGTVDGQISKSGSNMEIDANVADLMLQRIGIISEYSAGLPVSGIATATVDLSLGKPKESNGDIDIRVDDLRVAGKGSKLKVRGLGNLGLELDEIEAGTLLAQVEVKQGVAHLKRLSANGRDLALAGEGIITLKKSFPKAQLDLMLNAKLKRAYQEKSDKVKAMLMLAKGNPKLRRATTPEDSFQYEITGVMRRPSARPAGNKKGPALPKFTEEDGPSGDPTNNLPAEGEVMEDGPPAAIPRADEIAPPAQAEPPPSDMNIAPEEVQAPARAKPFGDDVKRKLVPSRFNPKPLPQPILKIPKPKEK